MQLHARPDLTTRIGRAAGVGRRGIQKAFRGDPVLRCKRRGLLRNVCVALGNVGDPAALAALERAARDPEPLISEHARWAIGQILERGRQP